jgi:hypothetical protein
MAVHHVADLICPGEEAADLIAKSFLWLVKPYEQETLNYQPIGLLEGINSKPGEGFCETNFSRWPGIVRTSRETSTRPASAAIRKTSPSGWDNVFCAIRRRPDTAESLLPAELLSRPEPPRLFEPLLRVSLTNRSVLDFRLGRRKCVSKSLDVLVNCPESRSGVGISPNSRDSGGCGALRGPLSATLLSAKGPRSWTCWRRRVRTLKHNYWSPGWRNSSSW